MNPLSKSYKATIDEGVEAQFRLMEISGLLGRQFWQAYFLLGLVSLVVSVVVPMRVSERAILFIVLMALCLLSLKFTFNASIRWQLRKALITIFKSDNPIDSEFLLSADGLSFKQPGHSISFPWEAMIQLHDRGASLEIICTPNGIVEIPKRIFQEEELNKWRTVIANKIHEHHAQDA